MILRLRALPMSGGLAAVGSKTVWPGLTGRNGCPQAAAMMSVR
jgi:hypothetical protein